MRYLFIIGYFIFAAICSNSAYAASSCGTPPSDFPAGYDYCTPHDPTLPLYYADGQTTKFASAVAACNATNTDYAQYTVTARTDSDGSIHCHVFRWAGSEWDFAVLHMTTGGCNSTDTLYQNKCYSKLSSCLAGQIQDPNSGQCVDPCAKAKGPTGPSGWFDWGTSPSGQITKACGTFNGASCEAIYSGGGIGQTGLVNGVKHYWANGEYDFDGYSCKPGTPSPPSSSGVPKPPTDTCAQGQDSAMMNGQLKCYDHQTGKPVDPKTGQPTDKPIDPGTTTTSNTTSNPDGTKTTTTVSCDGVGCITTKTTTNSDGSTVTTSDKKANDFCDDHPDSIICNKSSYSGSCDSPPVCTGDAIQCQIAVEQQTRDCQLYESKHDDYDKAKDDADSRSGEMGAISDRTDDRDVSAIFKPGDFDSAVGSCSMSDKTVSFAGIGGWGGVTVSVPYSRICDYAPLIQGIVMGLSAMSCAMLFYYFMIRT